MATVKVLYNVQCTMYSVPVLWGSPFYSEIDTMYQTIKNYSFSETK